MHGGVLIPTGEDRRELEATVCSGGKGGNTDVQHTPQRGTGTGASVTLSMENNILAGEGKNQKNLSQFLNF